MPKQEFPFPMPNGWFCVTRVGDIQNGESKPFTFFYQAEDGIRNVGVTGVQTCALPICPLKPGSASSVTRYSKTMIH